MKPIAHTVAKTVANTAVIAPPPAKRGLISGVLLAGLTALTIAAAPNAAHAQAAGTLTIAATGSGGDRDSTTDGLQVDEGDTITVTVTANGKTAGQVAVEVGTTGMATFSELAGDFDIHVQSRLFTVPVGQTEISRNFRVNDDSHREGDETAIFTIGNFFADLNPAPSTWSVGSPSSVTVTIRENDQADRDFAISVDESTRMEGQTAVFTVALTGTAPVAGNPATVDWAVSGAGITADDYEITGDDTDGTLSFTALGEQTLTVRLREDLAAESEETLTITLSNTTGGGGNGNRITTATASVTIAANTLARRLTLTGPATVAEGAEATYTVSLQGTVFGTATDVSWTVDTSAGAADAADLAATTGTVSFAANDRSGTFTIGIVDDDATAPDEPAETFTVTITAPNTASEVVGGGVTTAISQDDDPAARAARVQTPLATFAKGATQLTAQAVSQRLAFTGNALSESGFSLNLKDAGFNLWATGARINASGNDNGVTHDGHTAALHLGADTAWNDGLLGIAIAQSAGSANFTANDISSTLKTSVLTVHPYFTRTVRNTKLWATAGVGAGEAELRETGNIKADTDLTLISAAIGATLAESQNASLRLGAQWSRAELDAAAFPTGQTLPKVTASALRLTGGAELSRQLGAWRPFLTVTIRRDSGDGDDGNAADYGGGVEWQNNNIHLRLAGRKHAQGRGPDEEHLTLTARKTAGRLNLGLHLSADHGINTADLLTGELRF